MLLIYLTPPTQAPTTVNQKSNYVSSPLLSSSSVNFWSPGSHAPSPDPADPYDTSRDAMVSRPSQTSRLTRANLRMTPWSPASQTHVSFPILRSA